MIEVSGRRVHSKAPFSDHHDNNNHCNSELSTSDNKQCSVHPERSIDAYCPDDSTFGCLLCFTEGHSACKNIALITVLARGIEASKELSDVQKAADRYTALEDQVIDIIKQLHSINELCHTKTLKDFHDFRSDIISNLDKVGEEITSKANKLKEENERKLTVMSKLVMSISEKISPSMIEIEENIRLKQSEQLYVALKKNGRQVIDSVKHMNKLCEDMEINRFEFQRAATISDFVYKHSQFNVESTKLASLLCTESADADKDIKLQSPLLPAKICIAASKVNIKKEEDKSNCFITAMTEISASKLILADWANSCLKLLDLTSNKIIQRRVLTAKPWDIAKLKDLCIAVSFPKNRQIQFFTTELTFYPRQSIRVNGNCMGLHCSGDVLVVSVVSPVPKVLIMDLDGNVLKVIQHDSSKKNTVFTNPRYVAFSPRQNAVYVSDFDKNAVQYLNRNGIVSRCYMDKNLQGPLGVTCGDGDSLYISSNGTNSIHVVSSVGTRLAIIQQSQSGVRFPRAVSYSSQRRTLFVSSASSASENCNFINILSLK